ncbi:T9SS type A sorting domain-containing protein [Pontibacter sp. G13]|uniref:T9SS type A sorting domain-containing protein n=1 Tax=Pontibacter sp. G13 TaxID=3074898 RepID=UPI00288AF6E5|nr:T9SS type A sorting domain-containing protein [Pontibacter sp. G13]WNJ18916.1 T9SS type A sorting domain-containing protein [Pontibacter sp. G13]
MSKLYSLALALGMMSGIFLPNLTSAQNAVNDDVCDAIAVPVDGTIYTYDNFNSTAEPGEQSIVPPLGGGDGNFGWYEDSITNSVWFTFVAPASGFVTIDLCNAGASNTDFDTQIAVYDVDSCGDFSTFRLLAANDDVNCPAPSNVYASTVDVPCLVAGETYYFLVDGWLSLPTSSDTVGNFGVSITELPNTGGSALSASILSKDPSCEGVLDGALSVGVTGGFFPYEISWSNGATDAVLTGLDTGSYVVTVMDACDSSYTATVSLQTSKLVADAGEDLTFCDGANLTVLGATPPASGGNPIAQSRVAMTQAGAFLQGQVMDPATYDTVLFLPQGSYPAGCYIQNVFFGIQGDDNFLFIADFASKTATQVGLLGAPADESWTGLDYDPVSGQLYGITYNSNTGANKLYTVDPGNGAATFSTNINISGLLIWLAIDNDGTLYTGDLATDALHTIDPITGNTTQIGPFGVNINFQQDADIDPETGDLYAVMYGNDFTASEYRKIDKTTGNSLPFGDVVFAGQALAGIGAVGIAPKDPTVDEYNYVWQGLGILNPFQANPELNVPISGTYFLSVQDNCNSIDVDTVNITVNSELLFSFTTTPVGNGSLGSASVAVANETGSLSYLWDNGETTSTIVDLDTGWYTVTVFDDIGCSKTDSVYVANVVSVDPLAAAGIATMEIYPNPNPGIFMLNLEMATADKVNVAIFDLKGGIVYKQALGTQQFFDQTIDLGDMAAGVYNVQVTTSQGVATTRMIVE